MTTAPGYFHRKLPADAVIHTRQPVPAATKDEEQGEPGAFEQLAFDHFAEALGDLARAAENRSNPVDEYNSASVSGAGSSASVIVQPTYEYMAEKIESIIVTGPTGAISLLIGDRLWALNIPASGVLVIAPISLLLSRTDPRVLTPAAAGVYSLELMGIADRRFKI